MTKGRKPIATEIAAGPDVDTDAVAEAGRALTTVGALQNAVAVDQIDFSQRIGARLGKRQAFDAIAKLGTVQSFLELQAIKESKAYRGYVFVSAVGQKSEPIQTWEQYCELVEGRSVDAVDLDLRNLKALGADAVEAIQQLGFGPAQMRSMRALPDDERTLLIEAAKSGDSESFLELAETLISNHQAEKKKAGKRERDLNIKLEARQRTLDEKNAELDALKEAEAARTSGTLPEREAAQLAQLQVDTETAVNRLAVLLATVDEVMREPATQAAEVAARHSLDYLVQRIVDACADRAIAVDLAERVTPIWAAPKAAAKAA